MSRCKLEEFISYEQPAKYIVDSDQYDDSYETPVLTAGKSFILGYTDEKNNIFDNLPIIIFDDFTTSVQFVDFPFKVKSSAMKLLKNTEQADIKYCYYLLKFLQHTPENHKRQWLSATSQNIVELPTIEKQKNIVRKLDKILEVIDNQNKQLELLDEAIKARFVEMFGDPMINPYEWKVINISEVLRAKASNGFFSRRDDYCDDGNVKVLGVANVVNRMYSQVVDLPRTNANEKDIEKFEVKYGDMLFCRSSLVAEGIGKASIIPEGVQTNILFECHVIRLPLDLDKCVPEFLQTLSTTKFFRNQIISKSKTATMTTIGQDGILKTNIILPPLEKQKEYYNFVKQIDKSRSRIQKSLEASQELFDSLMQDYFG